MPTKWRPRGMAGGRAHAHALEREGRGPRSLQRGKASARAPRASSIVDWACEFAVRIRFGAPWETTHSSLPTPAAVPPSRSLHKPYPKRQPVRRPAASDPAESAASLRGYGQDPAAPAAPARYEDMTLEQRRMAEALVESIRAIEALNPDDDSSEDSDGEPVPSRADGAAADPGRGHTWEEATGCLTVAAREAGSAPAEPAE